VNLSKIRDVEKRRSPPENAGVGAARMRGAMARHPFVVFTNAIEVREDEFNQL
jgi:hypothetical protein